MYIEDGTVEQLQPEARCIVQHSGFKEISEGWLSLSLSLFFFFFFLLTKHHYVHSASLVFVFFVLHPVVFRPYYQCQRN